MVASVDPVEISVLMERLEALEKIICEEDAELVDPSMTVSASLQVVNNRINSAMTGRDKMKGVLKRVNEIDRYLDPAIGECITLEDTAKMDIILTKAQHIRKTALLLESIQDLKPSLDSQHIKATPSLEGKLAKLSQISIEQHIEMARVSDDVKELVRSYNNVISTVSKQFVQWDNIVTKLELSAYPKKKK